MRAIIIEDDDLSRSTLHEMIKVYCKGVTVVATCRNGQEGLEAIKELKPDLIFLDIEMPDMTGFQMLKKVDVIDFEIVFTTAYEEFALRAFKVKAIDYLLKPIDREQLVGAVSRVASKNEMKMTKEQVDILMTLMELGE